MSRALQTIDQDGDKHYLSGMSPADHYFAIGETVEGPACIVEGYATGATVHEATGHAVAVAFACGNLPATSRALRAKHPDRSIVLCADDDIEVEGNPGLTKAREAAAAVGGVLAVPDFGQDRPAGVSDFNDMAKHRGLDVVAECIANARAPGKRGTRPTRIQRPPPTSEPRTATVHPPASVIRVNCVYSPLDRHNRHFLS